MSKKFFIKVIKEDKDYELKVNGKDYLIKGFLLIELYKKYIIGEFERKVNEFVSKGETN